MEEPSKHAPRTCPLATDQKALTDAFVGAIRKTRPEWEPRNSLGLKLLLSSFGVLLVSSIYYAGYNLASLRGELVLGSRERAAIIQSTTKLAEIVERIEERLDKTEQAVSRIDGQREGWRSAREREGR